MAFMRLLVVGVQLPDAVRQMMAFINPSHWECGAMML
jgi:hypothetical protein